MARAAQDGLYIRQLDFVKAFLNGDVEEDIYMQKPQSLEKYLCDIMLKEEDDHKLSSPS